MKIIPFNQNEAPPQAKKTSLTPGLGQDFQKALEGALRIQMAPPARDRVVAENHRAVLNTADGDLVEAQGLLSRLAGSLKDAGSEKLGKVHNLEGILYYFKA